MDETDVIINLVMYNYVDMDLHLWDGKTVPWYTIRVSAVSAAAEYTTQS